MQTRSAVTYRVRTSRKPRPNHRADTVGAWNSKKVGGAGTLVSNISTPNLVGKSDSIPIVMFSKGIYISDIYHMLILGLHWVQDVLS